jgi:hypothetical protein
LHIGAAPLASLAFHQTVFFHVTRGFIDTYKTTKDLVLAAKTTPRLFDEFMAARSELIKLANLGKVPLKARAGKLADLQDRAFLRVGLAGRRVWILASVVESESAPTQAIRLLDV